MDKIGHEMNFVGGTNVRDARAGCNVFFSYQSDSGHRK
jgi:hypothetical protein